MRFRVLVLFPFLWAAGLLAVHAALSGSPAQPTFLRLEIEAAKVLTLWGSWAAAAAFARGDYLRRAWFLVGLCMALLLVRDATVNVPAVAGLLGPGRWLVVRGVLVVLANVSQILGTWMLARAWSVAELSLPASPASRGIVLALTAVLAAAFAGPGLWRDGVRVLGGDLSALSGVASSAGDAVSLLLIAPLLLTALALRGGVLGQVWSLLAASYVAWLFYDAALVLGPAGGLEASAVRTASEVFRALGCTLGFSAGLSQRLAVLKIRELTSSAA